MKYRKLICINALMIVLLAGSLLLCTSCRNIENPNLQIDNLRFTYELHDSNESSYQEYPVPNLQGDTNDGSLDYKVKKGNIYSVNDRIEQEGFLYENLDIYKGKELPEGVTVNDFQYFDFGDHTDSQGHLLDNSTYLFLSMDVTNISKEKIYFTWNTSSFVCVDESEYILGIETVTAWEARYQSNGTFIGDRSYFHAELNSNETVRITIGYVIDDEWINSKRLYFCPDNGRTGEPFSEMKFFKINE